MRYNKNNMSGVPVRAKRNRNETEGNRTDRNETKQIETKRNKSKRNETKRNETKLMIWQAIVDKIGVL